MTTIPKQKPIATLNYRRKRLNFGVYEPEVNVFSMAVFRDGKQVTCTCSNPLLPEKLKNSALLIGRSDKFTVLEQNQTFFLVLNGGVLGQTGIPSNGNIMACDGSHQDYECEAGLHIPVEGDDKMPMNQTILIVMILWVIVILKILLLLPIS